MRADHEDMEAETAFVMEAEGSCQPRSMSWVDAAGDKHEAVLLSGAVGGEIRTIGIASIVVDEQAGGVVDRELNAAVAAYLIDAGDIQLASNRG